MINRILTQYHVSSYLEKYPLSLQLVVNYCWFNYKGLVSVMFYQWSVLFYTCWFNYKGLVSVIFEILHLKHVQCLQTAKKT